MPYPCPGAWLSCLTSFCSCFADTVGPVQVHAGGCSVQGRRRHRSQFAGG